MSALPKLVGVREVMDETGLKRASAERIMRRCRRVEIPGHRRWLVLREDVRAEIERHTFAPDEMAA